MSESHFSVANDRWSNLMANATQLQLDKNSHFLQGVLDGCSELHFDKVSYKFRVLVSIGYLCENCKKTSMTDWENHHFFTGEIYPGILHPWLFCFWDIVMLVWFWGYPLGALYLPPYWKEPHDCRLEDSFRSLGNVEIFPKKRTWTNCTWVKMDGWKTFSFHFFGALKAYFSGANWLLVLGRVLFVRKDSGRWFSTWRPLERCSSNLRRSTGKPHLCQARVKGFFLWRGVLLKMPAIITHVGPMYDIIYLPTFFHWNQPNACRYTSPMDVFFVRQIQLVKKKITTFKHLKTTHQVIFHTIFTHGRRRKGGSFFHAGSDSWQWDPTCLDVNSPY